MANLAIVLLSKVVIHQGNLRAILQIVLIHGHDGSGLHEAASGQQPPSRYPLLFICTAVVKLVLATHDD